MIDLEGRAEALCRLYGRRMSNVVVLRDAKFRRNGRAVRATRIQYADRFTRSPRVLALA
jgi:hypothetical protein